MYLLSDTLVVKHPFVHCRLITPVDKIYIRNLYLQTGTPWIFHLFTDMQCAKENVRYQFDLRDKD